MNKIITAAALVAFSIPAQAYDGWSKGRITGIRIQSSQILVTQVDASNPGQCPDTTYIYVPMSDSVYHKNMYAALLAAHASQATVWLALEGCVTGFAAVEQVWVK